MIISTINRYSKLIACFFFAVLYGETVLANRMFGNRLGFVPEHSTHKLFSHFQASSNKYHADKAAISNGAPNRANRKKRRDNNLDEGGYRKVDIGPDQPEMQSFQSVNANNMVDLFTGDFSYNIPLLDVGGYPIGLSYRSGISMDQEASWVGLGWSVNPGTITRNLRGLPDDFNGKNDSVRKVTSIRENKTVGVSAGADLEVTGLPLDLRANLGVFHNNYKGWGLENSLNASINAGLGSMGQLTGGLSINNNTQDGLTMTPSLSVNLMAKSYDEKAGIGGSFTTSLPYNSRSGLKGLQLSTGIRAYKTTEKNQLKLDVPHTSFISFASPTFTPSITIPYTSYQFSFTGKVGGALTVAHSNLSISGYVSRQGIALMDTLLALPSFGYLHYQDGAKNRSSLLDFNREKEIPFRDKPAVPHIALPFYTYDAFSITGEGTGGMFRAYRGDIGFVHDHFMRTKDESDRISIDVGAGNLAHGGYDLNVNRAFSQSGPWLNQNSLARVVDFKNGSENFEAAYFRNPGEKAINSKSFYDSIGGDDVVAVKLFQADRSSPVIQATNYLTRYQDKRPVGTITLTPKSALKQQRDKRTQVISYLNAKEASVAGLSKYIESYTFNQFNIINCPPGTLYDVEGSGTGLLRENFTTKNLSGKPSTSIDQSIYIPSTSGIPSGGIKGDEFSIRWSGFIKAPETGKYRFITRSDDGVRLALNDTFIINQWKDHAVREDTGEVNLIKGELYKIKLEYYENKGKAEIQLKWAYLGSASQSPIPSTPQLIAREFLYPSVADTFKINNYVVKEKRTNSFRKENHISEINVLNSDGRRYVYGIPVYNLKQKEATFSVNGKDLGNSATGLVKYNHGTDNTTRNQQGKDWYYNSEEVPAYAHSFLLTGILSADYSDLSGDGISEDDIGDAVKFNYSKVSGLNNPYKWRAPYVQDSASLNEGLKTDYRDDKGNLVYGEKELWYLHSIESKTMVATFVVENRLDLNAIDEAGRKYNDGTAKRLKEIHLYNKADFLKKGTAARPVKTVHFEYSYELCKGVNYPLNDTGKLTLKKVWFSYYRNNKEKKNPYVFNYHSNNPGYNIKSYDRWGNYKDPLANPGSSANNLITNAEYPYALQDSVLAARNAAAWTLDSIYLPSGGSIKVDYESDEYAYVQNKRAMQLFKLVGLGSKPGLSNPINRLYSLGGDNLYVYVSVPKPVASKADIFHQYLSGVQKLYFKMFVKMPSDYYGSGHEYVSCYADLDPVNGYGLVNSNMIWIKLSGISLKGDERGLFSPLAKAAIQFLRQNLPSKAYPGSEVGDQVDLKEAVMMVYSMVNNIKTAFESFDRTARTHGWAVQIDTGRSFVRLNSPVYQKLGGGHRVKRIVIYDNWDKMTNQRAAQYGQEYSYSTLKDINGVATRISSGVASYEPGIGGEENPFRQPIEYVEKVSAMGPVSLAYTEEPLGESLFPSPSVGYSKVRVRTINYKDKRSANGFEESNFYTAYDFPVFTDRSLLDDETKKRYKPALSNFLRINAKHYVTLSQGFKIELNDMHGKLRSQVSYPETDPYNFTSYTENIYRVEQPNQEHKRLANTVMIVKPDGSIDSTGVIGKDVELMMDMREQVSITSGNNVSMNTEMFTLPFVPPLYLIPTALNLAQREETQFRSVATLKVIQRYGILDSVIHIDKGSKVSTKDVLYDSETGNVLLTRTQNEFNDPVYNFSYPSHWAYEGMGLAYKNIDVTLKHIYIRDGKITQGVSDPEKYFSSGDEILVAGKLQTGGGECAVTPSTFPSFDKVWVVDSSAIRGGAKVYYFIDRNGKPYNGFDIDLKIIRSGRRNIQSVVGSVTTLENPVQKDGGQYALVLNSGSKVIHASVGEFKQYWQVQNVLRKQSSTTCVPSSDPPQVTSCTCSCLKELFDYLIVSGQLFIESSDSKVLSDLIIDAQNEGFKVTVDDCPLFSDNANGFFYALNTEAEVDTTGVYKAQIGNSIVTLKILKQGTNIYNLQSKECSGGAQVAFYEYDPGETAAELYVESSETCINEDGESCNCICLKGLFDYLMASQQLFIQKDDNIALGDLLNAAQNNGYPVSDADCPLFANNIGELFYALTPEAEVASTGIYKALIGNCIITLKLLEPGLDIYSLVSMPCTGAEVVEYYSGEIELGKKAELSVETCGTCDKDSEEPCEPCQDENGASCTCNCLRSLFDYLIQMDKLFLLAEDNFTLQDVVTMANSDGYAIKVEDCPLFSENAYKPFYALTDLQVLQDQGYYKLLIGSCIVRLNLYDRNTDIYSLASKECTGAPRVEFYDKEGDGSTQADLYIESCESCQQVVTPPCQNVTTSSCNSMVADTSFNPYVAGVLGNWRAHRSYVYYGNRAEADPTTSTDIRRNGTFAAFAPFWSFQAGRLNVQYDTTNWIWNSEITLFNRKGLEIENRDPLGRYNSGLYGYNQTLPVAVVQNARYREAGFEGFEDYDLSSQLCDTACQSNRHFDFSAFKGKLTTLQKHSGKNSLRLNAGEQAGMVYNLIDVNSDTAAAVMNFALSNTACASTVLKDIKVSQNILLPSFSPYKGKKMLISAWVKEEQGCSTGSYTGNQISVVFDLSAGGTTGLNFLPMGSIIEGWQRYEMAVDIPANATRMNVVLMSTSSSAAYFDDVRIHPFNANMKSFVYNPSDMRLMAELDENNYATFFEYDDDGTLIRVKKETERGIKTLKETRSALVKQ